MWVALVLALAPIGPARAEPSWTALEYAAGVGCGLFVQFFTADGSEPTVDGRLTGFFPRGAPPSTSPSECLSRCRQWAGVSSVKTLAAGYRARLAVTKVTRTCWPWAF